MFIFLKDPSTALITNTNQSTNSFDPFSILSTTTTTFETSQVTGLTTTFYSETTISTSECKYIHANSFLCKNNKFFFD